MGAVLHGCESASLGRTRSSHVGRKFRFVFAPNSRLFGHDRATIGPRSRRDRATIVVLAVRRSPSDRLATITPRQPSDRGSIAPRSRFDRTAIVEFFHDRSAPSDVDLKVAGGSRSLDRVNPDYESRPPSDVDLKVAGGSRSLDRVNPDYESRPPSDGRRSLQRRPRGIR